jgi:hypothetical protein
MTTKSSLVTVPSKISVTHLPPWEQPFLLSQPTLSPLVPVTLHLPDRRCSRPNIEARRRHHFIYWYIPFAGETTSPLVQKAAGESHSGSHPRALGTVALYSALLSPWQLLSSLRLFVNHQDSHSPRSKTIHPFTLHKQTATTPSRCCSSLSGVSLRSLLFRHLSLSSQ